MWCVALVSAVALGGCEGAGIPLFSQLFLIIVTVSLGAALWLRFAARRGWLGAGAAHSRLEVLERRPFGPRSELIAARVADHVVVFASTPAGLMRIDRVSLSQWKGQQFAEILAATAQRPETVVDPRADDPTDTASRQGAEEDDLVC